MTNTINLTTNNCIRHGVDVSTSARSVEWVITFEYAYYSKAEADDMQHTKTVRYMMGTAGSLVGGAQTTIGTQQINLPENKPSNPFTSAYLIYYGAGADAAASIATCISTAAACTGTTSTQASIEYLNTAEQTGSTMNLDDVAGFFNTNYTSSPQTFTASVDDDANGGMSAEVVITYKFQADTSSTILKTVWFWVGQETLSRTNTAFNQGSESGQTNWNTFWPESGTKTFRNGAVYSAFDANGAAVGGTGTITIDDTAVGGTDSNALIFSGTGENSTIEMMAKISTQVPATFGAQTDINFSLSTDSTTIPMFRSPISYFTVETATSLAFEKALLFVPLAILVPVIFRLFYYERKRKLALSLSLIYKSRNIHI